MPIINMKSSASLIKGQGVGSCYEEQVRLVSQGLPKSYDIIINRLKKSDIAHYHTINFEFFLERLLTRSKTAGIGYVHFLPDTIEESLSMPKIVRKVFYKYLIAFYNSMDYLVAVNPTVIKKLEDYGVTRPKILYIPNFVTEEEFYPQDETKIFNTKLKYGLPLDKFIVMGAGQLQKRKGVLEFIETAKLLPNIQFIWAGGFSFGKMTDGYEEIKRIMSSPPDNVKFLGIVERSEMADVYNVADVMFLPSYDELFPMSVLEAISCKKPILLRDITVYPQILFDYYLKGRTASEFASIISNLQKDNDTLKYWQEKSWECHNLYTENKILKMWEKLYEEAYIKIKQQELIAEGNA